MALRKFKPVTAGTRWRIGNAYAEVTTNVPEKTLVEPKKRTGGRNSSGHLSMRYIGGGHKKKYRIIDFKRNKAGVAEVASIEYDPNRTAFIALVTYADGEKRYILAPQGLVVGAKVEAGADVAPEVGNALPMKNMPLGTNVHNIEMQPGQGFLVWWTMFSGRQQGEIVTDQEVDQPASSPLAADDASRKGSTKLKG